MKTKYIFNLKEKRLPPSIGNKAQNLRRLQDKGFLIPVTYVCTWEAYDLYLKNDIEMLTYLESELRQIIDPNISYAVRSSANLEDNFEHSFAGQFKTVLNVCGVSGVLQAIWAIWATTQSDEIRLYLQRINPSQKKLRMAVIIQEMVLPIFSGVAFSKHPMTGMDETVIEVVKGQGDALVQEGVTPYTYINKWGVWIAKPAEDEIDLALMQELVDKTRQISKIFRKEVDLEWVYDGEKFYWVQMREITTIKNIPVYSNSMAKEMMPGMIKPLVWSLNIPLVCGAWKILITEMIGKNDIDVMSLARPFYYRAYFNMQVLGQLFNSLGLPREVLEMMMGIGPAGVQMPAFKPNHTLLPKIPRLLRMMWDKWNFSPKIQRFLNEARQEYQKFSIEKASSLSQHELIETIDRLFSLNQKTAYYTIVTPLLMSMYNMILRSQLKKANVDPDKVDVMYGVEELKQFDPNVFLMQLHQQFSQFNEHLQSWILNSSYAEFQKFPQIREFQRAVADFIQRFGHLSDIGTDISAVPWRENPDLILRMIASFKQPKAETKEKSIKVSDVQAPLGRRIALKILHRRAQRFRLHREQISSLYTYGYGLFRVYFLALADQFVQSGFLVERNDIFYLTFDEVRQIVENPERGREFAEKVNQRKKEMEDYRDVVLPGIIYGDTPPSVGISMSKKLIGVPTSQGYYTGPVRLVKGIADFNKVRDGDIIVVPFSDVGWTPLFARAGGVISESGGILSHSSIIAREYKIPAVVSVADAFCLTDDMVVTIDGYKGEIIVHDDSETSPELISESAA